MAASLNFDSAYRALKRHAPEPVYYLTGGEELLKEEIIDLILDQAVDAAGRDFNFDLRSAGDLDGERLHSLVETPPILAERRVVVVKNLEQWRKNAKVWQVVHKYIENPSPTTILVLTHGSDEKPIKDIAKHSVHVTLEPLDHQRKLRWIKLRTARAGFGLAEGAAEHLLNVVGSDLAALATEIDKLAAISTDGEIVDKTVVADLVGVRFGETQYDWIEAVLTRDTPRAVGMLDRVLCGAGVTGVRLTATLGTGLVGVRLARAFLDDGAPAARVEGMIRKTIQSAKTGWTFREWNDPFALLARAAGFWTTPEVDDAIRAAYHCDIALKSTTVSDARGTITDMLLAISRIEVAV